MMHCFDWSAPTVQKPFDMTENWGLTVMPHRYGDDGLVVARPRPAARLAQPQEGDIHA
jgi:hypothetical protein